jgi:hypothetical protein
VSAVPDTGATQEHLSRFTCTVLCALDDRFTPALLLLCSSADAPCWMRSGCLVAACISVRAALLDDALVSSAVIAAEHVLYACMSASQPAATAGALQALLSDACLRHMHVGQAEMLAAVVQHVAVQTHALSRQPQCMSMRTLVECEPGEPQLHSIPLRYNGRLLLMAKVTVPPVGTNVRSTVLHGWSLNIKQTTESEHHMPCRPGVWLPVSLFLQNHVSVPRKVSFLVGLIPARDGSSDGSSDEDQLAMMAALHEICSTEPDLAQVRGCK